MLDATQDDRRALLERAYGTAWLARVARLPLVFQEVAVYAALDRLDGWQEEDWLRRSRSGDSYSTKSVPDTRHTHADAPNEFEQSVRVLRDEALWPWQSAPVRPTPGGAS